MKDFILMVFFPPSVDREVIISKKINCRCWAMRFWFKKTFYTTKYACVYKSSQIVHGQGLYIRPITSMAVFARNKVSPEDDRDTK